MVAPLLALGGWVHALFVLVLGDGNGKNGNGTVLCWLHCGLVLL